MTMIEDEETDVAEALAALESAQETTKADHILDFGPWWYAPIYAFAFAAGATSLAGHAGTWFGALGNLVVLGVVLHDRNRRQIELASPVGASYYRFPVLVSLVALGVVACGWFAAATIIDGESVDFFPTFTVAGWALNTCVFLMVRWVFHSRRERIRAA